MLGLVGCVKHRPNTGTLYYIADAEDGLNISEYKSEIVLREGEIADICLDSSGHIGSAAIIEESESDRHIKHINGSIESAITKVLDKKLHKKGIGKVDELTEKMREKLGLSARLFLRKLLLGAPIIVRFHNDADGSSGACSIFNGINWLIESGIIHYDGNVSWIMQPGVAYSTADSTYDQLIANNYSSIEKPLLLIVDFGTSADSNKGIESVKDKFDIIWLDHHPIVEGFSGARLGHYVNPWSFGGDSNYTAGFLASVFTSAFSKADNGQFEDASFIGDYSEYAAADKKGAELSTILDLLTSDTKIGSGSFINKLGPYEIMNILKDKKKAGELLSYANSKLNEVLDAGLASVKRYKTNSCEIYVLDFERVRPDDSKYPLPGRYASKLLERIRELYGSNVVVVVHVGAYVSIRIDRSLCDSIGILEIISSLRERYSNLVEAGGGHKCAASIKLADKADKSMVLKALVSAIREKSA